MNWRLVSEFIAYFDSNGVYFAPSGKKAYQSEVTKNISESSWREIIVELNEVGLKFGKNSNGGVEVFVQNEMFPCPEKWYTLKNFEWSRFAHIILNLDILHGNVEGKFEVAFSDSFPGTVTLTSREFDEFPEFYEEFKRRMNCELCKKTKKWVPGHRYDSLTETIYYICPVRIRKSKESWPNSEYISDELLLPEAYIITNRLYPDDKTIEDVLTNHGFGDNPEDLKIIPEPKSMVECGDVLSGGEDIDINNFREVLAKNTPGIRGLLDIYSCVSFGKLTTPGNLDKLTETTRQEIWNTILEGWDEKIFRGDIYIGKSNKDETNLENIRKRFITRIPDQNYLKKLYYPKLYESLGIDLPGLIEEMYAKWMETDVYDSWENYIKFFDYIKSRNSSCQGFSRQRVTSTKHALEVIKLSDIYGEGSELTGIIIEIINSARKRFGIGVSEFHTDNIGTRRQPMEYTTCKVTLEDILKFLKEEKGISEVSKNLKSEIIRRKFCWVDVVFDKDGCIA